MNRQEVFSVMR